MVCFSRQAKTARRYSFASLASIMTCRAIRAKLLSIEPDHIGVADRGVSDVLINLVAGRIGEVGVEETEFPPFVQQVLADRGGAGTGVTVAALLRRRIDRPDPDPVGGRAGAADHADRPAIGDPEPYAA